MHYDDQTKEKLREYLHNQPLAEAIAILTIETVCMSRGGKRTPYGKSEKERREMTWI